MVAANPRLMVSLAALLATGCTLDVPEGAERYAYANATEREVGCAEGKQNCDDGNACTTDSCDKSSGCVNSANSSGCDDGDACTTGDKCGGGKCQGGSAKGCDDGNACTTDSCDKSSGCVNSANSSGCDDGDACTTGDKCGGGKCQGGSAKGCDDGNACTTDSCDSKSGQCKWSVGNAGASCGGGQGKCTSGYCVWAAAQGRKMVYVPAGSFWMGCNGAKDSSCGGDEKPQHEVTLSAYWLDMYEVTVSDYAKCQSAGKCTTPTTGSYYNWGVSGREQHPINGVDWSQAQTYCQWLGSGYDLPTEAQWEKGARGGCEHNGGSSGCQSGMRTYPWGEASPSCDLAVFSSGGAGCGQDSTWAVGSKPKGVSPYGAHDMAGNVWEWVLDWYDDKYYAKSPKNDPVNNQSATGRVDRGGSWVSTAGVLRSGNRVVDDPDDYDFGLGFRCAR